MHRWTILSNSMNISELLMFAGQLFQKIKSIKGILGLNSENRMDNWYWIMRGLDNAHRDFFKKRKKTFDQDWWNLTYTKKKQLEDWIAWTRISRYKNRNQNQNEIPESIFRVPKPHILGSCSTQNRNILSKLHNQSDSNSQECWRQESEIFNCFWIINQNFMKTNSNADR
jgi:hypothetical protein